MKNLIKNNWISLSIVAFAIAWGTIQLQSLPDQVPTHFNSSGQADQYSSKYFGVYFLPLINVFTVLFVNGLLRASPEAYSAKNSQRSISMLNIALTIFLTILYFAMIKESTEPNQWMHKALPVGISLLTLLIGNYLGKLEKNFVAGFRLPWTLASDDNWKQTHRFAAKAYVILGTSSLLISLFHPSLLVSMAALILGSIAGVVYSYRYFIKYEQTKSS